MIRISKDICIITLMVFLCLLISYDPTHGSESNMEPLYNLNEATKFAPQIYKVKTSTTLSLFPLPQDGAVGTNTIDNAITMLTFKKDRIKSDEYFKNALYEIGGSGLFLNPISQDTIAFGQVRYFMFFNFRTKDAENYRISTSIDESIEKVAIADARQRHFLFEIQEFNRHSENPHDYITLIQLIDLSGKEPKLIKEIKEEQDVDWFAACDKFFMFNKDKLQVFTTGLEPAYHPLADAFKRNTGKIDAWRIHMHPTLPFAIIVNYDLPTYIVSWGQGRNDQLIPIANIKTSDFNFSPDGKWVVIKSKLGINEFSTYLAPISEKYPNFIGSPVKLLDYYFNEDECAWTTNPTSFVGAKLDEIYRWELTTAAHPESTKPDFHEYIVEKDLEKLTKEKKQGLGNGKK